VCIGTEMATFRPSSHRPQIRDGEVHGLTS
jgi:hypothetical protein